MKTRILSMMAVVVLILAASAQAIEPRAVNGTPILSFRGTTAYCSADCIGNDSSDTVKAVLTLYEGNSYVDSWVETGRGSVYVSGNCEVDHGTTYRLVLTIYVNNSPLPSVSTRGTCP